MTLVDESAWRGRIDSGGRAANLEAFAGARCVTIRGDVAPHPF